MNLTLLALALNCKQVDLKAGGGAVAHGKCVLLQIKQSSFNPGHGHCVVFLEKTLNCHSGSLHPSV